MPKYVEVKFLKAHPRYAYSAGNEGLIDVRKAFKMYWNGYVTIRVIKTLKSILKAVWGRLGFVKIKNR